MIIAIDGPAGSGKSTTARALAHALGWSYIDTGAMYRAVALSAQEQNVSPDDGARIAHIAQRLPLRFSHRGERIHIGARDVSGEIRTPEIGALTSRISAHSELREIVVALQRELARAGESECGGAVLEGRDIQTVVFPDAEIKIFLSAAAHTRATRRGEEWNGDIAAAVRDIEDRDRRDSSRENSPLCAAPDAIHLSTDGLSTDQIVEKIVEVVRSNSAL